MARRPLAEPSGGGASDTASGGGGVGAGAGVELCAAVSDGVHVREIDGNGAAAPVAVSMRGTAFDAGGDTSGGVDVQRDRG